jgi:hypothetical protein
LIEEVTDTIGGTNTHGKGTCFRRDLFFGFSSALQGKMQTMKSSEKQVKRQHSAMRQSSPAVGQRAGKKADTSVARQLAATLGFNPKRVEVSKRTVVDDDPIDRPTDEEGH